MSSKKPLDKRAVQHVSHYISIPQERFEELKTASWTALEREADKAEGGVVRDANGIAPRGVAVFRQFQGQSRIADADTAMLFSQGW